MVEWSREYYIDPNTTGLNAVYGAVNGTTPQGENGVDGPIVVEPLEGSLAVPGRQLRGSLQTLRGDTSERER